MKIMLAYIAPFINSSGGAEKICCQMANEMTRRGHNVSIVYCYGESGAPVYPLDKRVSMYNLMAVHPEKWGNAMFPPFPKMRKIGREWLRLFSVSWAHGWQEAYIGKQISEDLRVIVGRADPDVIVSYWPKDSSYLINYAKVQIPVITMFHFEPDILARDVSAKSRTAVVKSSFAQVPLKKDEQCLKRYIPNARTVWIPNAVPQYSEMADLASGKETFTIISMARLDKTTKRQHIIVEAFAKIANRFPHWQVELWGQDWSIKYRKELEEKVRKYNLESRVKFMGLTERVLDQYVHADLFAWPSSHEGFGLALAEAMSAGLPAVAFESCSASAELISNKSGILVKDGVENFAEGLAQLMGDKEKRVVMGKNAKEEMKKFAAEKVWDKWEEIIEKTIKGKE